MVHEMIGNKKTADDERGVRLAHTSIKRYVDGWVVLPFPLPSPSPLDPPPTLAIQNTKEATATIRLIDRLYYCSKTINNTVQYDMNSNIINSNSLYQEYFIVFYCADRSARKGKPADLRVEQEPDVV